MAWEPGHGWNPLAGDGFLSPIVSEPADTGATYTTSSAPSSSFSPSPLADAYGPGDPYDMMARGVDSRDGHCDWDSHLDDGPGGNGARSHACTARRRRSSADAESDDTEDDDNSDDYDYHHHHHHHNNDYDDDGGRYAAGDESGHPPGKRKSAAGSHGRAQRWRRADGADPGPHAAPGAGTAPYGSDVVDRVRRARMRLDEAIRQIHEIYGEYRVRRAKFLEQVGAIIAQRDAQAEAAVEPCEEEAASARTVITILLENAWLGKERAKRRVWFDDLLPPKDKRRFVNQLEDQFRADFADAINDVLAASIGIDPLTDEDVRPEPDGRRPDEPVRGARARRPSQLLASPLSLYGPGPGDGSPERSANPRFGMAQTPGIVTLFVGPDTDPAELAARIAALGGLSTDREDHAEASPGRRRHPRATFAPETAAPPSPSSYAPDAFVPDHQDAPYARASSSSVTSPWRYHDEEMEVLDPSSGRAWGRSAGPSQSNLGARLSDID